MLLLPPPLPISFNTISSHWLYLLHVPQLYSVRYCPVGCFPVLCNVLLRFIRPILNLAITSSSFLLRPPLPIHLAFCWVCRRRLDCLSFNLFHCTLYWFHFICAHMKWIEIKSGKHHDVFHSSCQSDRGGIYYLRQGGIQLLEYIRRWFELLLTHLSSMITSTSAPVTPVSGFFNPTA